MAVEAEVAVADLSLADTDINWDRLDKTRFHVIGAILFTFQSGVLHPTAVVKTRLQVAEVGLSDMHGFSVFRRILKYDGIPGLYRGFGTSAIGSLPGRVLALTSLEVAKDMMFKYTEEQGISEAARIALANGAAGLVSNVVSCGYFVPLDVISQRLMVQGLPGMTRYNGPFDVIRKVLRKEGIRGLYRGFGLTLATQSPASALWWGAYGVAQHIIWRSLGYGIDTDQKPSHLELVMVQATAGTLAGACSSIITTPIDTVKTRLQVMNDYKGRPSVLKTMRRLVEEDGWQGFYRGFGPRFLNMSLWGTSMIVTYELISPGCSSIGYGAASELGPLRVSTHAAGLEFNKYAWNKEANLLFVESPVGVGFSYTNTSSDLSKLDDGFVAEDAYSFLVNWLSRFPEYQSHDFYIAGESYAGHYVPQLAELVYDHNKEANNLLHINLKGFLVGNPETDDYYDSKGLLEYAWSHSVVSDQVYELAKRVCDFKLLDWTDPCNEAMNAVFKQYNEIDIYNIYAPKCNLPQSSSSSVDPDESSAIKKGFARRMRKYSGYDPCFSNYAEEYFNRIDVQKSLHANVTGKVGRWSVCNDSILRTYNFTVFSVLPIYSKIIREGLRIWIYSGDTDGRVPVIGSRYCVEALGLPLESQWQPWFLNHQVGGRFVEYKGLTMVTVKRSRALGATEQATRSSCARQLILEGSASSNTSTIDCFLQDQIEFRCKF